MVIHFNLLFCLWDSSPAKGMSIELTAEPVPPSVICRTSGTSRFLGGSPKEVELKGEVGMRKKLDAEC
jgi:hypothetical protein